jgi:hypothetical protein
LDSASVGLPVVGTGQKKALCISSGSLLDCSPRLLTLPAFMLLLLPLRFKLPDRRMDAFFFSVLPRDKLTVC